MGNTVHIPEAVDGITVGGRHEDMIVVIGIGQHFRPYPPETGLPCHNPEVHIVVESWRTAGVTVNMFKQLVWLYTLHYKSFS